MVAYSPGVELLKIYPIIVTSKLSFIIPYKQADKSKRMILKELFKNSHKYEMVFSTPPPPSGRSAEIP